MKLGQICEAGRKHANEACQGGMLPAKPARLHGLRTAREIQKFAGTFVFFFRALIAMFRSNEGA